MAVAGASPVPAVPFTLRQLECFVTVAECGSITGAAERLHASDSAVADAVTALEKVIGARLLQRQRARGVSLTSDGLAAMPMARDILMRAEQLALAVGHGAGVSGVVRVGVTSTLAPMVLPALIVALRRDHPAVLVSETTGDHPALISALERGELDIVVTFPYAMPAEVIAEPICATETCVVLAQGHPLAARSAVRLADLADEPLVLLDSELGRTHSFELLARSGVSPLIAYRTDSQELCLSLIGHGLGYSLLPRRAASAESAAGGRVVYVRLDPVPRDPPVVRVRRREPGAARVDAVAAVLDLVGPSLALAKPD